MDTVAAEKGAPRKSLSAKQKIPQYYAALVVTIACLSAGNATGWTSPVLPRLQGEGGSLEPLDLPLTGDESSWVSSLLTMGAIFGPILGGICVDRFGRKISLITLAGAPSVLGWIITLVATGTGALYAARIFIGISVSASLTLGPAYIAEMSSPSERGTLCSFPQLMISIGIMLQFVIGPYSSYYALSGVDLVFPIIFMIGTFFLPESPYYLLARGDDAEAETALKWFRGGSPDVSLELEIMSEAVEESGIRDSNFLEAMKNVFETRGNRRAIVISSGLMFFQQFCGINAVLFNAEEILKGSSGLDASTGAMVVGAVQIVASWCTTVLVDRAGRRPLLILSCLLASISLFALGAHAYLDKHGQAADLGWLPVTALVVYIVFYCLGLGPLPWVVLSELFPSKAKSAASMLAGSFCWLLAFVVTRTFRPIWDAAELYGVYWLYACCTLLGVVFVYLLQPETKCKSLEQIQKELEGN
ncbi:facilitated trehalose transporter Tret1-like [Ischnura elegans]|uniref:facilitated trehalose transporter Tret1-like n=1 Tax=Ischnura elegans TaxID=197161 RepID=UPI001ED882D6|nr:facilitated trehalose transporter Tret1-like [Ischnura elegans]